MWPTLFNPTYRASPFILDGLCFGFIGEDLLIKIEGELPNSAEFLPLGSPCSCFLVGELGEKPCQALLWEAKTPLPEGVIAKSLKDLWNILPEGLYGIATRAKQMLWWDKQTRFCGACGTPTISMNSEPAKSCPSCGERAYPRIAPAMMVLVHRGQELLLARPRHAHSYSVLSGFVEAGESVEECVHREVAEEVGLRIQNLRWFKSQPWPFPYSLLLAFHADYVAGEIKLQTDEIEEAHWFRYDALPLLPNPVSLAWQLIHSELR